MALKVYRIFNPRRNKRWEFVMEDNLALPFLADNAEKATWGKPDRWIRFDDKRLNKENMQMSDQSREVMVDGIMCPEWHFPSEYSVESIPATEDHHPDWIAFRVERNLRLAACDWTRMKDSSLTKYKKSKWTAYRKALRNMTDENGFDPKNPVWPKAPNE